MSGLTSYSAKILSGGTVSTAIELVGYAPLGIQMPATFTGTAITLQASVDGATYQAVNDDANAAVSINVTGGAGKFVAFGTEMAAKLSGIRYLKLVSGTAEGADRILIVTARVP